MGQAIGFHPERHRYDTAHQSHGEELMAMDPDDFLKESGRPHFKDPKLGTIVYSDGSWYGALEMDIESLGDGIDIRFDCEGTEDKIPEDLSNNTLYVIDHLEEWWNGAAQKVNEYLETNDAKVPEQFELKHLFFSFADAPVRDGAKWTLELLIEGLLAVEVEFEGLRPVQVEM